jgi:phospholipid/cholesterol/gamma-HCH transport system ATP-binding protein
MIRFENVRKAFGAKWVLDDVSFHVARGETAVIVGLSGAGKSVTLKHIIQLLTQDSGRILIEGEELRTLSDSNLAIAREKFGVLFQSAALLQWMTVRENVALPLKEHSRLSDDEIYKIVDAKLASVNLTDAADKYPSDISGGMQKRAGLARAIVMNPQIILYDEPTSGLDPVTSRRIDQLIIDMQKQLGVTSVVVTHDLHSALAIGSRIIMLHDGKIIANASPAEFIKSEHEIVKSFLESQFITRKGVWEREVIHE